VDESQCRRSSRVKGATPEYTGQIIDTFFDADRREAMESDEEGGWGTADLSLGDDIVSLSPVGKPRRGDEEKEAQYAAIISDSKKWLAASRAALCSLGGAAGVAPTNADEWLAEATRRWGPRVADVACDDWEAYVSSRISHPPPPSPMELLQEFYAHDPWQLLVACVLMSRVSSWNTKHTAISGFFANWPTPSAVLDAEPGNLLPVMKPLGLFENRLRSLIAVSEKFLSMPVFDVGLDKERKIYGIGEFGYSSYLIFCRYGTEGGGAEAQPSDKTLQGLVRWLKSQSGGGEDASGEESEESEEGDEPDEESEEEEEQAAEEIKPGYTVAADAAAAGEEEESIATRGRRSRRRCTMVKPEVPAVSSPPASNSKRKRATKLKKQSKAAKAKKAKTAKVVKPEQKQRQPAPPPAKKQKPSTSSAGAKQDIRAFFVGKAAAAPAAKAEKATAGQADIRSFFGGK
jgi:methyl-CpG-binding domain protein 4